MRLLFLSSVFPTPVEPTKGVFNLRLVEALARQHRVSVIAPIPWTQLVRPWNRIATSAEIPVLHPISWYTPKVFRSYYGWFYWQSIRTTALRHSKELAPDAVLSYWAHPDGAAAIRLARHLGVPAIVMVGGSDVLLLTADYGRKQRIVEVLQEADAVVTIGSELGSKVASLGIPPERIHVTFRGVDTALFSPGDRGEARQRLGLTQEETLLLWVGRMVPVKGLDVLLDACARLHRQGRTFRLALVGDGESRGSLQARAAALGLRSMVHFVGSQPHHALPDWFRAANATVLPSRSEGVPNVLRESLACGTPFVASQVGGIPKLAEGTPSKVVAPGDALALSEAISDILYQSKAETPIAYPPLAGWEDAANSLVDIINPLATPRSTHALMEA